MTGVAAIGEGEGAKWGREVFDPGKGIADERSLVEALRQAVELSPTVEGREPRLLMKTT